MYLTVTQQLKNLSKEDYLILRDQCHLAKNLTNQAIYNNRQYFFENGKFLSYYENYKLLKESENYELLNSNMGQQIIKVVYRSFKSFKALRKLAKEDPDSGVKARLPKYLEKDGFTTLVIGQIRLNGNKFVLPYSRAYSQTHKPVEITIPPIMEGKKIKEIRIVPMANARFFEIQYVYFAEEAQRKLDPYKVLALDVGVNNLVTGVTNDGETFIIDGRKLKSINQWFNKYYARLQSIKDKQGLGKAPTRRQARLSIKRANQIRYYLGKAAKIVIDFCLKNNIGTLVIGFNKGFQRGSNLGKVNNQNFTQIPFGKLRNKLSYLCELNGIAYIEQEESYTSKASFFDGDPIPVFGDKGVHSFSGTRVKRGLYKTSSGMLLNADVNGALNILRKSNVVCLDALYRSGAVNTPKRIRV